MGFRRFKISRSVVYLLLVFWTVVQLYPLVYMFLSSLKTERQIMFDPWGLPHPISLTNFVDVWNGTTGDVTFGRFFVNSIIVTSGTLLILNVTSLLCGYALAKYRFPGRNIVYMLMICFIAVPIHSLLIPVFLFLQSLDLLNSLVAMMLIYSAFNLPFSVIIMKSYYELIPHEIEEAAMVDGCEGLGVFLHVGVPMSRGVISTITIVNLTSVWSEFMFASILLTKTRARTLPVAISMFNSSMYNSSIGALMAGIALASIPLLVMYFMFQKQIVRGIAVGAIR